METIISDEQILADSGFHWRERGGVKVLICRALEEAGFVNGFSTRLGGVSKIKSEAPAQASDTGSGGDLNLAGFDQDSAENIHENRRKFLNVFDGNYQLTSAWQVHGSDVKIVATEADAGDMESKFDALVSDLPGILIGVKTADCVPILIGDPRKGAFAAVHAGWRGTSASIARKAVVKMREVYSSDPADLIAAIGPAALCGNYEIGQEVIDAFAASFPGYRKYFTRTHEGHALVDLHLANEDQLTACGVNERNIYKAPLCTMERTDVFFSYRVEKSKYGKTGRLMSVIGLAGT
jgi:polyphenol oxidase